MIRPAFALAAVLLFVAGAAAPTASSSRTASGRPNLEGVWTNASLTRLSRPAHIDHLVLTAEEARALAAGHFHNVRAATDALPLDPDRDAPPVLERLPPVGNYNAGWVEPGTSYGVVRGDIRSSWIVDPPNGQLPFRREIADRVAGRRALRATPDDPEALSLGERCLIGFGGTAGPPMLNVLYNNYYRIVQTEGAVMIAVEMVHDARIVSLIPGAESKRRADDTTRPEALRWLGNSVGHWQGDTLVIETTGFHPARSLEGPFYYSSNAKVLERLTRTSSGELLYEFVVDDPDTFLQPVRGEMTFRAVEEKVFEYACHEGNYAMTSILKGARLEEEEAEAAAEAPAVERP